MNTVSYRVHDCCIGGWTYVQPYGWVTCATHEAEAAKNGQPKEHQIPLWKWLQPKTVSVGFR